MDVLAKALATVLVELLRYFQARQDIQELVRKEIQAAGLQDANEALGWKAAAVGSVDGGASLRVRDGALQLSIPSLAAYPGGLTIGHGVPAGEPTDDVPPPA